MVMRHIIILLALLSVSCSSALPSFKPYRMDIQQGNVVTSKMMMQLRPGMTKSQVRFIMGTPLIQDSFHSNRWDYFYQMRQEGKIVEQRRVILEFEDEALARVRGDVIPAGSGQQDLATPATTPESLGKTGAAKAKKDEKGLVDKLKFWKSDEQEKKANEQPAALVVPVEGETPIPAPLAPSSPTSPVESSATAAPEPAPAMPPVAEPAAVADPAPRDVPAAEPVPDSVKVESVTSPEPLAAPVAVPMETQSAPAPSEAGSDAGEPRGDMQLMLDRSINLPTDAGNPSNVSNPSQAPDADFPSEASPDFFERMLEKIGF
jgi:outer membrane protein assembly factor BamE